ncbi:hypothetical protein MTO96_016512 [Rhipicephalus appendiculatus]
MRRNRYAHEVYLNSHCTLVSDQTAVYEIGKQAKKRKEQAKSITLLSTCRRRCDIEEAWREHARSNQPSQFAQPLALRPPLCPDTLIMVAALLLLPQLCVVLPRTCPEQTHACLSFLPGS